MKEDQLVGEYRIGDLIGKGPYSRVHVATHVPSQRVCAVKIIDARAPNARKQGLTEAAALREMVGHKNIIKLEKHMTDETSIYLFMEYAKRGDLYSYLQKKGPLRENLAKQIGKQMVESILFCHALSIIHHDIKLENILIGTDNTFILSDFGLACKVSPNESIICFGGSPLYMAPEIFSHLPHNFQVDVWSLGVCIYFMVFAAYPFQASSYDDLEEHVLFDEITFPLHGSEELLDLLRRMFEKDPEKRISMAEVRKHRWWGESSPVFPMKSPRGGPYVVQPGRR